MDKEHQQKLAESGNAMQIGFRGKVWDDEQLYREYMIKYTLTLTMGLSKKMDDCVNQAFLNYDSTD